MKQTNDFVKATMEKSNLIIMTVNQVIYNLHLIVQKGYQKIDDFIEITLKVTYYILKKQILTAIQIHLNALNQIIYSHNTYLIVILFNDNISQEMF